MNTSSSNERQLAATRGASIPRTPEAQSAPEQFYTIDDVAQSLKVSLPTVYRLIKAGALPVTKIGACTRISETALKDAIVNGFTQKYRRF